MHINIQQNVAATNLPCHKVGLVCVQQKQFYVIGPRSLALFSFVILAMIAAIVTTTTTLLLTVTMKSKKKKLKTTPENWFRDFSCQFSTFNWCPIFDVSLSLSFSLSPSIYLYLAFHPLPLYFLSIFRSNLLPLFIFTFLLISHWLLLFIATS